MKINEVEKLIDLPKKTIKYYEEQELIIPKRNSSNSYREYDNNDISVLRQIKLLRKLGFSIESIKIMLNHPEQSKELFQHHILEIEENVSRMENAKKICLDILSDNNQSNLFDSAKYFEKMVAMEKEGHIFMDENAKELKFKKDNRKTIIFVIVAAAIISCAGIFLLPLNWIGKISFTIIFLGLLVFLVSWHSSKVAYICKKCNEKFVIGFLKDLISPQLPPDLKYLKCPDCGKWTWAKETYRD